MACLIAGIEFGCAGKDLGRGPRAKENEERDKLHVSDYAVTPRNMQFAIERPQPGCFARAAGERSTLM